MDTEAICIHFLNPQHHPKNNGFGFSTTSAIFYNTLLAMDKPTEVEHIHIHLLHFTSALMNFERIELEQLRSDECTER